MLIVNDTHRLLAGGVSLNVPCPYSCQPLQSYPLILADDAAQTVYSATCVVELATPRPRGTRSSSGCSPPITSNWRGKPPTELATIVNLIASSRSGRKVCLDATRVVPPPMSRSHMPSWKPSPYRVTASTPTDMTPESREYLPGIA